MHKEHMPAGKDVTVADHTGADFGGPGRMPWFLGLGCVLVREVLFCLCHHPIQADE